MKVAMIGCGKLGQDCAEVMAEYCDVVGYDIEPRTPTFPMRASIKEAVEDRDIIFIAAPTPHDPMYGGEAPTSHLPNKDFDYTIVTNILNEVNMHVSQHQLVVLISTVLPGTVRSILRPCITNARFIYNPYLIAMGTVKWDMVNPDMIIIGTEDGSITGDAEELINFYTPMMKNTPRYEVGTWDEAESIKIFYNTFISTKVALVNMIQDVAERSGNINVDVVTSALARSTQRIMGPAYMTAGMGDGGACHPRDNIALRHLAERLDLGYDLFSSIMRAREVQAENLALRCLKNGKNVTILGKAYKPNVPYTYGSSSMLVEYYINAHGGIVNYYDENTGDLDMASDWTQVVLIGYWDTWTLDALNNSKLDLKDTPVIIDPWRKLSQSDPALKIKAEVIHYGDTRNKRNEYAEYKDHYDWWYQDNCRKLVMLWPELEQHMDTVHLIEAECAGRNDFMLRPTESIVEEILEASHNGKTKFLFLGMVETYSFQLVAKINRIADLIADQVDSKNLIYLCSSIGIAETYNENPELFKSMGGNKISVWSACSSQMFYQMYEENGAAYNGKLSYEIKEKGKNFLSFNRVPRRQRLNLINRFLENKELLDTGYCSFDPPSQLLRELIDSLAHRSEFNAIKQNASLLPLKLNITEERTNPANLQPDDMKYFSDSYFSIVTETGFYNIPNIHELHTNVFFTEKVFKPIVAMHPFILFSYPKALEKLRQMGYRTFHPFINETYDTLENPDERFGALWGEIVRLLQKTPEEWIQWQTDIKEIVEHNHHHFFTNKNYLATDISPYFT